MELENCTFCDKKFDNFQIEIEFTIRTKRLTEQETWEKIGNLNLTTKEILCEDCYNKFMNSFQKSLEEQKNV